MVFSPYHFAIPLVLHIKTTHYLLLQHVQDWADPKLCLKGEVHSQHNSLHMVVPEHLSSNDLISQYITGEINRQLPAKKQGNYKSRLKSPVHYKTICDCYLKF